MVNQIFTEFRPLSEEQKLELNSDMYVRYCQVRSSKNKPGFSALIRNSLDFVPKESGRTTIRAEEDDTERGHKVTFTVEDNGI